MWDEMIAEKRIIGGDRLVGYSDAAECVRKRKNYMYSHVIIMLGRGVIPAGGENCERKKGGREGG